MKDFFLLKVLDRFRFVFQRLGVDYPMMRKILQLKFMMDDRRVPTVMMNSRRDAASKANFRTSLLIYAFIGVFIGLFLLLPLPLFFGMNLVMGMLIFMIMTTMISDFSSILLDVRDKSILLPRPVEPRTLNAAKLIYIVAYLARITLALSAGSLAVGTLRRGAVFFFLFLLQLVLICGFVILLTSLLYYAILTVFSGEKLKDIINYFQIVLTVFITVGYQFLGRVFDLSSLNGTFSPAWWNVFLPSMWFSAPFSLLLEHDFSPFYAGFSLLAVVIPVVTTVLYVKVVAPRFERNLQKLNSGGESRPAKKRAFQRAVSNLICFDPLEKVFFRFTQQMLANERKLKLRLYPSLAFSVMMPFLFFVSFFSRQSFSTAYESFTQGRYYLYLYFSAAVFPPLFSSVSTSENYRGAWIYRALPVESPAAVMKGAFKAFLCKYVLPIQVLMSVIFLALFGVKIIPDLLLIFANTMVLILVTYKFSKKELPFCQDFQYTQNGSSMGMFFLSFLLCGFLVLVHYVLAEYTDFGVWINTAVSLGAAVLLWRISFQITWEDLAERNREEIRLLR